jgi:hypothetical protein
MLKYIHLETLLPIIVLYAKVSPLKKRVDKIGLNSTLLKVSKI